MTDIIKVRNEEIAEARRRWLEALRGGAYLQGKYALKVRAEVAGGVDSYCCLGVLCDVLDGGAWDGIRHHDETDVPSGDVLSLVGIEHHHVDALTELNDHYDRSFDEIADYIENDFSQDGLGWPDGWDEAGSYF